MDEDGDVTVVVVTVVVVAVVVSWDNNDTGITCRAAPTAKCAAEPSVVDCVVVAIGAYGVSAPILCNKLPICEVVLTEGAVCTEASALSDGDCTCSPLCNPLVLPIRTLILGQDPKHVWHIGCIRGLPREILPDILVPCRGVHVVELAQVHGLGLCDGEFMDMTLGRLFLPVCIEKANPVRQRSDFISLTEPLVPAGDYSQCGRAVDDVAA